MEQTKQITLSGEYTDSTSKDQVIVECAECGDQIKISKKRVEQSKWNFCDRDCMGAFQRSDRVTLECEYCGDEFEVRTSKTEQKYCSRECLGKTKRNRVTLECEYCGDKFEVRGSNADRRRFCSNSCSNSRPRKTPASFTLEGRNGYPGWTHPKQTTVHQLVAVSKGHDPSKVYGRNEWSVDHKNGMKLDNRPENIELMRHHDHGKKDKQRQIRMEYSHKEILALLDYLTPIGGTPPFESG
jgi:endogenous inhibitor of DNA gyrase (YacG/DUF329 family)